MEASAGVLPRLTAGEAIVGKCFLGLLNDLQAHRVALSRRGHKSLTYDEMEVRSPVAQGPEGLLSI